ncbi:alkaline phosphatase synthesis sensor protein PhoR [Ruminiclostridium hungatei]|uniref:histidine kinase n=1 Tax=Ruminiclostridium hungatei TaxID=48256 RepID=A0A1V4SM00_RUMHU|nr:HAMP domain-containing sensor histidine kinase [Ruminiclostridium hungatei]OPX44898.1 alkaline phosphatase synthesis sensor protein PhoR [Ruminiclostridium hungatei]
MSIYSKICNVLVLTNPKELVEKYSEEIREKILSSNYMRIRKIIIIVLVVDSTLLLTDFLYFRNIWPHIPSYRSLFYLHLTLFPLLVFYLALYQANKKKRHIYRHINLSFIITMVVWSEILSLNAQSIHGQISAYLIAVFSLSALITLTPVQFLLLLPCSFMSFTLGLIIICDSQPVVYGHIINSFCMCIVALFVSNIMYSTFCGHVIKEQIINAKNEEIALLNNELILKVKSQTDELVKMNTSLELEKLRVSLFANISHEFKTPINVILSAEQLMEYKLKDENARIPAAAIKKCMYPIKQNCYRLIRLVSNIIDINTIDCGNMSLTLENRNIVKTVEDIVLPVAHFVRNKNISLIFDTEMEEKLIAFDQEKIERVILNLLSNALKFTPPGGAISVNVSQRNSSVIISVRDTGIGIPPELHTAIFDKFVQVDRSFTKPSEGSGIGLSLAKSIIDLHMGKIHVNSRLGEGSEFVVELPEYTVNEVKAEGSSDEHERIEKIKIEFSDIYL